MGGQRYTYGALYQAINSLEGLEVLERLTLYTFAVVANPDGSGIYVGEKYLCEKFNKSPATIKRVISSLKAKKLIVLDGKRGYNNRYNLQLPGVTPIYQEGVPDNITALENYIDADELPGQAASAAASSAASSVYLPAAVGSGPLPALPTFIEEEQPAPPPMEERSDEEVRRLAFNIKRAQRAGLPYNIMLNMAKNYGFDQSNFEYILNETTYEDWGLK